MKNLVIFSYYSCESVVELHIRHLIEDLSNYFNDIIVTSNMTLSSESRNFFKRYTNRIYERDNVGFDAGAYKEVICTHLSNNEIQGYDEIAICNDTFFGPFVPISKICCNMNQRDSDIWGMNIVRGKLFSHIQSYFIVFRKAFCQNGSIKEFFESIHGETTSRQEVFVDFEVALFDYIIKNKFEYDYYTDTCLIDIYKSPFLCIRDYGLPVVKKKYFEDSTISNIEKNFLVSYIEEHFDYDISFFSPYLEPCNIKEYNFEQYLGSKREELVGLPEISKEEFELFCMKYSEVAIFGAGILAKKCWYYFNGLRTKAKKIVVSDDHPLDLKNEFYLPMFHLKDLPEDIPIVVCMNKRNSIELLEKLTKRTNVLLLWKI